MVHVVTDWIASFTITELSLKLSPSVKWHPCIFRGKHLNLSAYAAGSKGFQRFSLI